MVLVGLHSILIGYRELCMIIPRVWARLRSSRAVLAWKQHILRHLVGVFDGIITTFLVFTYLLKVPIFGLIESCLCLTVALPLRVPWLLMLIGNRDLTGIVKLFTRDEGGHGVSPCTSYHILSVSRCITLDSRCEDFWQADGVDCRGGHNAARCDSGGVLAR